MKVARGWYIPSAGEMILNGINTFRGSPQACLKSISYCPQDNFLYDDMTVEEHLILISSLRDMSNVDGVGEVGGDSIDAHISWILTTLGIADKKTTLAKKLSGGMKRRLCLAMSTVGFPPVILCDEPSSGVDSMSQRGIWKLLEAAKKKSAVLLTSHSALETVILSDSIVRMESSEQITQTTGIEKMAFSIKDEIENITTEYELTSSNTNELANIIANIPNDGSEWKIASKRLTSGSLPPLEEAANSTEHTGAEETEENALQTIDEVPETLNCNSPGTWRQICILMSLVFMHKDRIFHLVVVCLPFNGALIWLMLNLNSFNDDVFNIILPIAPIIVIFCCTIALAQLIDCFATERSLGVTKLLFGQGISRFAYLSSHVIMYSLLCYPVRTMIHLLNYVVIVLCILFVSPHKLNRS